MNPFKKYLEIIDEAQSFKDRSGVIPFYRDSTGVVKIKVMKPSDPDYGGIDWQLAKGKVEPELTPEANALKEGSEEVGLRANNIKKVSKLLYQNNLHVFVAEIRDPDAFDEPHYETGDTTWLTMPDDLPEIRYSQQWIFQAFIDKYC